MKGYTKRGDYLGYTGFWAAWSPVQERGPRWAMWLLVYSHVHGWPLQVTWVTCDWLWDGSPPPALARGSLLSGHTATMLPLLSAGKTRFFFFSLISCLHLLLLPTVPSLLSPVTSGLLLTSHRFHIGAIVWLEEHNAWLTEGIPRGCLVLSAIAHTLIPQDVEILYRQKPTSESNVLRIIGTQCRTEKYIWLWNWNVKNLSFPWSPSGV